VKKSLTILMLVGVSLLSAQDIEQSGAVPQLKGEADTASTAVISRVLNESLVIVPGEREKLDESIFFKLPEEGKLKQPESKTFASEFRKEMNSLALTLPDLSASWFGVSWYVRNPLRFKLSPGSTYAHQLGLSSGRWVLSVDGIGMTSLENLDVALHYPFAKNMSLNLRYSDMQYKLNIQATGKLPWER
jgi:hypothetical protein